MVLYEAAGWRARVAAERDLISAGGVIRDAIARYYEASGGKLPQALSDLVIDKQAGRGCCLPEIPSDPITGRKEWGLLRIADRGISGVHSLSQAARTEQVVLPGSRPGSPAYAAWRFEFSPTQVVAARRPVAPAVKSVPQVDSLRKQPSLPQFAAARAATIPPRTAVIQAGALAPVAQAPRRSATVCTMLQRVDDSVCRGIETRSGPHAAIECRVSAQLRASACSMQSGTEPLPLLAVPSPSSDS